MTAEDALNEIMALVAARNKAPQLLTVKEAAKALAVSPLTIKRWVNDKKIPFVKVVGAVRFRRKDIERFIERGKREVSECWR